VNTTDLNEVVLQIESTTEEKKKIVKINITSETNAGQLTWAVDRESFFEGGTFHLTAEATIEDFLEFMVDRELEPGEVFRLFLQNVAAGVNAEINGDVEYEIL